MSSLTLVVMAAGMGSRYGGLKQIEPVGDRGEILIDYSVYDALRAGFDRIVVILRRDIEKVFRETIGKNIEAAADTAYVFQSLDQLPGGFSVPEGRIKPWGTGQAVLVCREAVQTPFVAINADDFYGPTAFEAMAGQLRETAGGSGPHEYAMVGYRLVNTVSAHGRVTRGVCSMDADGYLVDIRERFNIEKSGGEIRHSEDGLTWAPLPDDAVASMNFWGFTPELFGELERLFPEFLREEARSNPKAEFLIPEAVGHLVHEGKARVKILPTQERWFGVTFPEDLPLVRTAIRGLVQKGIYPENLWPEK